MTTTTAPRLFALVPCAGIGARAGTVGPKQYAHLRGRALVAHTLRALLRVQRLHAVLVVLAGDDSQFEHEVPEFGGSRGWLVRRGGATRAQTVANGLQSLRERGAADDDWVLVHDAARPCLTGADVERLIGAVGDDEAGGILAVPLADTLKRADGDQRIAATEPRAGLWLAQTPQLFRHGTLLRALGEAADVTDEAAAVEALGLRPMLVPGSLRNLKVTYAGDLPLAAALLAEALQ